MLSHMLLLAFSAATILPMYWSASLSMPWYVSVPFHPGTLSLKEQVVVRAQVRA